MTDLCGARAGCRHALGMRCHRRFCVNRVVRAGCSREMVSRILKDLENGGYIRVELRRIVLVKKLPARW